MIKLYITLLLFSFSAWSRVSMELILNQASVKQGEIVEGRLVVKQAEGQAALTGLKGKNLGKTLYLMNVSPFMGKQGQLESQVKVIFLMVPPTGTVLEVVNGEEIFITWKNIEVVPTEPPKSFLLGDFEIPARKKILKWLLILIGIGFLIIGIVWLQKYFTKKTTTKNKMLEVKKEIMNCKSYEDVVVMWRQKRRYLDTFPDIENNFKSLEDVLFKYQFKSQRTKSELEEVISAYNKFKTAVSGVLNGI